MRLARYYTYSDVLRAAIKEMLARRCLHAGWHQLPNRRPSQRCHALWRAGSSSGTAADFRLSCENNTAPTSPLLPRLGKAMMELHPSHAIFLQFHITSRILFPGRRSRVPKLRRPAGTPIVRLRVRHRHRASNDCERQRPCSNERFFHAMPLLPLLVAANAAASA